MFTRIPIRCILIVLFVFECFWNMADSTSTEYLENFTSTDSDEQFIHGANLPGIDHFRRNCGEINSVTMLSVRAVAEPSFDVT